MQKKYLTDEEEANYLKSDNFRNEIAKTIEKDTWDKGMPMIYKDKDGNIVEHWKNGTINILYYKENIYMISLLKQLYLLERLIIAAKIKTSKEESLNNAHDALLLIIKDIKEKIQI